MEFAALETPALAHVDDSYYYGAYCGKCKHSARLSLRCATCGRGFGVSAADLDTSSSRSSGRTSAALFDLPVS
jgi:hypothetical protein